MFVYTLRRLVFAVGVIWAVYTLTFCLAHIEIFNPALNTVQGWLGVPEARHTKLGMADPVRLMLGQHGDVNTVERIREEYGLNDPILLNTRAFRTGAFFAAATWGQFLSDQRHKTQYFRHLLNAVLDFDLGKTFRKRESVAEIIATGALNTVRLALAAIVIAAVLGLALGILSAVYQDTWIDRTAMVGAILGISVPVYLVGLLMILVFIKQLRWIPGIGMEESLLPWLVIDFPWFLVPPGWTLEVQLPTYLVLPALALGVRPGAALARMMRTTMLEVIRQDYVRTARAKGLSEWKVVMKHAVRNALIPVVTILGLELAGLLTGAILTETVFAYPGLGFQAWNALKDFDVPLIMGTVLFVSIIYVVANLLVDLSYAFLDPRIRYS
ncbi:MAG: ABC transporter permease [Candidatus Riflebacteria bacterium]|nr:ABC transporter permease [Candidatus Riflebacteria bacterium]